MDVKGATIHLNCIPEIPLTQLLLSVTGFLLDGDNRLSRLPVADMLYGKKVFTAVRTQMDRCMQAQLQSYRTVQAEVNPNG